mmetsp:Transcript_4679/g.7079  ORF Transcript_4679/g.7079 Transcript_4679/m.7079 type:complete len:84 (-) Transcript_4679:2244-2495(-)
MSSFHPSRNIASSSYISDGSSKVVSRIPSKKLPLMKNFLGNTSNLKHYTDNNTSLQNLGRYERGRAKNLNSSQNFNMKSVRLS